MNNDKFATIYDVLFLADDKGDIYISRKKVETIEAKIYKVGKKSTSGIAKRQFQLLPSRFVPNSPN